MIDSQGRPRVEMLHDYPPVSGGGLALAVRDLASLLSSRFNIVVRSSRLVDHFADDRGHPDAATSRVRWSSITGCDCLVVHWTFSFRWLSTIALAIAPALRHPTLCVVHTAPDHCQYNRMRMLPPRLRRAAVATVARLMARCDEVVALSPSHARVLLEAGLPVTRVLPLPVGHAGSLGATPARTRWLTPVTVGVAGELSTLKGTDELPDLLTVLAPEHVVIVSGRGPLQQALRDSLNDLPIGARAAVTMMDRLPPEQMPGFYRRIDCLLLCSRTESQSRVAIEAMLAGVIVLSRPVTGVEDLVLDGFTGYLIDPSDPASVRDRLRMLVEHPEVVARVRTAAHARAADVVRRAEHGWLDLLEQATKTAADSSPGEGASRRRSRTTEADAASGFRRAAGRSRRSKHSWRTAGWR